MSRHLGNQHPIHTTNAMDSKVKATIEGSLGGTFDPSQVKQSLDSEEAVCFSVASIILHSSQGVRASSATIALHNDTYCQDLFV